MAWENLLVSDAEEIRIITLNRPERRNALSLSLMQELIQALQESSLSRAVILASAGKVFCSGHDLGEMRGRTHAEYEAIFAVCTHLMGTIQQVSAPVIAEVQGLATAAGCQLAATCDLVVASDEAAFATPGVKIGLFCSTPMVALTRAVGRKRALEMLLTGRLVPSREAAGWGLVNRVVPAGGLRASALDLARQIARASRYTVGVGKAAFYRQVELAQADAYEYARGVMTENACAADAQEGLAAFLEKRPAIWACR